MLKSTRDKFNSMLVLFGLGLLVCCANIGKPQGGDRDKDGPRPDSLSPVSPPHKSTGVTGKEIIFRFNEYLRPASYNDQIFISPVQVLPPEVTVKGKILSVKLRDTLRANTTYIVSIGKGIKDNSEGNKMKTPLVYAFSTGNKLDSLYLRGKIINPWTGEGEKDFTVLLYETKGLNGDSIFQKMPLFATETDSSGIFKFDYLPSGNFKLYGVEDTDQSFSWSQSKEKLALMANPLLNTEDSVLKTNILELYSFLPDNSAPKIKAVRWVNKYAMVAEFKDPLHDSVLIKGISTQVGDTAGKEKKQVLNAAFRYGNPKDFFFQPDASSEEWTMVYLNNYYDSLGNHADTAIIVKPADVSKKKVRWFREPGFNTIEKKFYVRSDFPLIPEFSDSLVKILDTGGVAIKTSVKVTPFQIEIRVKSTPDFQIPHKLVIEKGFGLADSLLTDTATIFNVTFPDPNNFGLLEGEIVPDSTQPNAKWIMLLVKAKNNAIVRRTEGDLRFKLEWLEPGGYNVLLFKDDDNNGTWTPGSILPYKLPEKIVVAMNNLDVRAKWEMTGLKIYASGINQQLEKKLKP